MDASITHSQRKPKSKPFYEVVNNREDRDDEADAQAAMHVIEVTQPSVGAAAGWVKKSGKSIFGFKQDTVVDNNGLVIANETTAANWRDSKPLLDKAGIKSGNRVHADKAYLSRKLHDALKLRGIKNNLLTLIFGGQK